MSLLLRTVYQGTTYTQSLVASTTPSASLRKSIAAYRLVSFMVAAASIRWIGKTIAGVPDHFSYLYDYTYDVAGDYIDNTYVGSFSLVFSSLVNSAPVAIFTKLIKKTLISTSAATAALYAYAIHLLAMIASTSPTSIIRRVVNKTVVGTTSATSVFTRLIAKIVLATTSATSVFIKSIIKTIVSSTSVTSSFTKRINKIALGTTSATSVFTRLIAKTLTSTTSATSVFTRLIKKTLIGTTSTVASVVTLYIQGIRLLLMAASTSPTSVITRAINKTVLGTSSVSAFIIRLIKKTLAGTTTPTIVFNRLFNKILLSSTLVTYSLLKTINKTVVSSTSAITAWYISSIYLVLILATSLSLIHI
jgi:hypothetical protein